MFICVNGHVFDEAACTHHAVYDPDAPGFGPAEYGCPECGTEDYGDAVVCKDCGEYERKEHIQKCKNCGNDMCEACHTKEPYCGEDCKSERIKKLEASVAEADKLLTDAESIMDGFEYREKKGMGLLRYFRWVSLKYAARHILATRHCARLANQLRLRVNVLKNINDVRAKRLSVSHEMQREQRSRIRELELLLRDYPKRLEIALSLVDENKAHLYEEECRKQGVK
jgi:hypothetical protein